MLNKLLAEKTIVLDAKTPIGRIRELDKLAIWCVEQSTKIKRVCHHKRIKHTLFENCFHKQMDDRICVSCTKRLGCVEIPLNEDQKPVTKTYIERKK